MQLHLHVHTLNPGTAPSTFKPWVLTTELDDVVETTCCCRLGTPTCTQRISIVSFPTRSASGCRSCRCWPCIQKYSSGVEHSTSTPIPMFDRTATLAHRTAATSTFTFTFRSKEHVYIEVCAANSRSGESQETLQPWCLYQLTELQATCDTAHRVCVRPGSNAKGRAAPCTMRHLIP